MANRWRNSGHGGRLYFWGAPKSLQMVTAAMKLKTLAPWKESYGQPRQHITKQRHYFANKGPSSQGYGFSSGHVWMRELDCEESWAPKNWCFWTVVLRRLLRVPWTARRSNQSILNGISPGCSLEGLMLKLKRILWPPDAKSWLTGKDPDAGKDWRREEKGMTEDEMLGWHHWLSGHGFGWTSGAGDGQGGLVCCSSWGRKESDTTERLNWMELTRRRGGETEKAPRQVEDPARGHPWSDDTAALSQSWRGFLELSRSLAETAPPGFRKDGISENVAVNLGGGVVVGRLAKLACKIPSPPPNPTPGNNPLPMSLGKACDIINVFQLMNIHN